MRRRIPLLLALLSLVPVSARADLSFVQVVQAQSSGGKDGVFGKSWVELRERKMRLVSAYARKLRKGVRPEEPVRFIQILDPRSDERVVLDPETKTYATRDLASVDYGHRMAETMRRGAPRWRIAGYSTAMRREGSTRRLMGVDCARYRISATLELYDEAGREETARMDQHVWVAPVKGRMSRTLLDLMAFENRYREASGGGLSPLDYERYQLREAAAYLQVSESELRTVANDARARMRDLPSYPVASLVTWWMVPRAGGGSGGGARRARQADLGRYKREKRTAPRRMKGKVRIPRMRRHFPRMKVLRWGGTEARLDRLYGGMVGELADERRRSQENVYPRFEEELRGILVELVREQDGLASELPAREPESKEEAEGKAPFFEVYAELHGLETPTLLPENDFRVPVSYRSADR